MGRSSSISQKEIANITVKSVTNACNTDVCVISKQKRTQKFAKSIPATETLVKDPFAINLRQVKRHQLEHCCVVLLFLTRAKNRSINSRYKNAQNSFSCKF